MYLLAGQSASKVMCELCFFFLSLLLAFFLSFAAHLTVQLDSNYHNHRKRFAEMASQVLDGRMLVVCLFVCLFVCLYVCAFVWFVSHDGHMGITSKYLFQSESVLRLLESDTLLFGNKNYVF